MFPVTYVVSWVGQKVIYDMRERMFRHLQRLSFLTIPVMLLALRYFKNRMRDAFMEMRRKRADMNANLAESISGVRVTQSFVREDGNQENFDQ